MIGFERSNNPRHKKKKKKKGRRRAMPQQRVLNVMNRQV